MKNTLIALAAVSLLSMTPAQASVGSVLTSVKDKTVSLVKTMVKVPVVLAVAALHTTSDLLGRAATGVAATAASLGAGANEVREGLTN